MALSMSLMVEIQISVPHFAIMITCGRMCLEPVV